ncbi:hypothetical protein ACHWQZ_G000851 [Mnemiopsis leidyi]
MWFPWSDSIKTRLCRFLLHHYIGHYLEEKLSLDQMSIELYAGKGTIHNVALNTETLNDLLDQLNLPFEITEGFIGRVSIDVPWQALVSSSTNVEVEGLEITVQPKHYCATVTTSMMDSVRNMTSSLVLAQHVMEEEVDTKLEGLEAFAHMIESVLSRVTCSFSNTAIRLQSRDTSIGVRLELVIDKINYFDEREQDTTHSPTEEDSNKYIPTSIAHKVILWSGIKIRVSESPPNNHLFSYFNESDEEREEESPAQNPEPNVIAKFLGEQQIKIHLKINDQLPGPKLDMECNVGSIHAMLSPHNVHILSDLIQSINTTLSDIRKEATPLRCQRMSNDDFAKLEQELHSTHLRGRGMSGDGYESDFFYSMNSGPAPFPNLDLPPLDTDMQSIPLGGTADKPILHTSSHRITQKQQKHSELMEDQIVVQLNVRYIAVTLLHQNLTNVSVNGDMSQPMVTLSSKYFAEVADKVTNKYENDAATIRSALNKVCPHDHLFLVSVNTSFRLELMTSTQHIDTSAALSVVRCEIEEALFSSLTETNLATPNIQPVLLLDQRETRAMTGSIYHPTTPALNLIFKSSTANEEYRTNCQLDIGNLSLICDITMLDRVGVFHKPPHSKRSVHLPTVPGQDLHLPTASMVRQDIYEQVMGEDWSGDQYQETFVSSCNCNSISVTFRFPIPDMRPSSQRTWWAPALRADYVVIHIDEATAEYSTHSNPASFTAEFSKLNCEYLENSDSDPIQFLLAGSLEEEPDKRPRIVIKSNPAEDSSLLVVHSPSPPPSLDNILHLPESKPSPFASKRVMYESQELVMPGSRPEMDLFEKGVKENSRLSLEFHIPELLIYLQDKQFFEILYNRIFTDLCLWTPGCPVVQETNIKLEPEIFKMCTSTAHRESDSDEEDNEFNVPVYKSPQHSNSWLSLSFEIQQSRVSLNCTVPPNPEQSPLHQNPTGELLLDVLDTHIFTVVEFEGDPDTSYFAMSSESGTLLHGNNTPVGLSTSTLTGSFINTAALNEILYTLPPHLSQLLPNSNKDYGFFTLASKVFFDQTKNIKEITLAVALQDVCHRVYVKPREENFALQLMEFFDVQDYTVPGYKLPLSVTSLHTHLWNLAVDYRPLYLPSQLLVTVQSLGISSNLALESSVTSLRVLLEDLSLYLAPGCEETCPVTDYVKVIDLDLFELLIKMLISPSDKSPQLEVDIKNNMLHIGTCADTCAALRDLLVYVSSEGDLHDPGDWTNTSSTEDLPRTTRVREHSSSDDIPSLMKSAVNTEIKRSSAGNSGVSPTAGGTKTEMVTPVYSRQTFTFPDDSPAVTVNTESDIANAVDDDSEDLPLSIKTPYSVSEAMQSAMDEEEEDQEFFVVESELVETMVAKGQFVIKKLVDTPCVLVEDHLTLPEDTDQLKSPPHFPVPLSRITVKELSLQWIMYGGNDFPVQEPRSLPGTPRSDRSRNSTSESGGRERKNSPNKNHEVGRNKSEQMEFLVSKMKLRFEQYPETALQIFRVCLILTDIEIRDKMGSSNFNKFLYQYSTDDNPRPSRTPMLSIKVVHSRSEELTEDAIIRVSLLPLRFNIDQDALIFMFTFFNNMSEIAPYRRVRVPARASPSNNPLCSASTAKAVKEEPLTFGKSAAVVGKTTACAVSERSMTSSHSGNMTSSVRANMTSSASSQATSTPGTVLPVESNTSSPDLEDTPTFIKAFVFSPEVPIRVDYKGKNVRGDKNLISNPVTNLLIGLAQLNCSELRLKSLCYRQGLLGYSRLLEWATNQWVNDIKTSQLPSILGGVGPMHSFIQLFSGVVDLVYLPVQQYREDGRIVKGLQRGANSFTHSTAVSLLQLTTKLFSSIQCVAEVTYDLVSPSQHRRSSPSFQHPADLREGLVNAYQVVTTDLSSRASSIQHAAVYNHSTKGITSAVGGVLREIPPTLLLPFITLPKVITQLSNGAQNHLKPSTLKEREEKYRSS